MSKARLISRFNISSANIADGTIVSGDIADNAITDVKLSTNLAANISGAVPKISTVTYPADDLAVSNVGGQTVTITGTGFKNGATVYIGATVAPSVTFTNTTSLSFTTPALTAGDYLLYVINPDGSTGIGVPGLSVSGVPTWSTAAGALANATESAYTTTINASADSNVTYAIITGALPEGFTINSNTGTISGTLAGNVANLSSNTTYNITVNATDEELQNTTRAFSITYIPTYPTWNSPNAGALTSGNEGTPYTANLNATSNSGITYSIPSGNLVANITISGSTLTGTPPEANTYYFTIRATDAEGHSTDRNFNVNFNVAADSNFANTVLLLNGDGTNGAQNNSFLDSSTNNFTVTRNGNTTQGTFSPFSQTGWSNYFGGTSSLSIANSSQFNIGTNDFTIEAFVNVDNMSVNRFISAIYQTTAGSDDQHQFVLSNNSGTYGVGLTLLSGTTETNLSFTIGTSDPSRVWNHVAVTRASNSIRCFWNGQQIGTTQTYSSSINQGSNPLTIGNRTDGDVPFIGYISNYRYINGTAVYTSNFTVPTTPLTAVTNTRVLTCQSNRFVDNSSNAFTISVNGNQSVQAFSPFAPTAAYSAATNGGSGYFDGNGDYLQTAYNAAMSAGTGPFTYECWAYPVGSAKGHFLMAANNTGGGFHLAIYGSTTSNSYISLGRNNIAEDVLTPAGSVFYNTWNHIVAVRNSSNNLAIFINGTRQAYNASNNNDYGLNNFPLAIGVGENNNSTVWMSGYIAGAGIYTSAQYDPTQTTITVPTAPKTGTGASFLCNFTNAGIIDQTGKNVLETVGNAQIDTGTKKFGTGSLAFDGAGDYLRLPYSPNFQMKTGDFTVEFWVYLSVANDYGLIFNIRNSTAQYSPLQVYIRGTRAVEFYASTNGSTNSSLTTSTLISLSTWTHVAVVRYSGTVKIYINGTADTNTLSLSGSLYEDTTWGNNIGGESGGNDFNGYIDDLRITKGVARYTSNFTPPTAAFSLR